MFFPQFSVTHNGEWLVLLWCCHFFGNQTRAQIIRWNSSYTVVLHCSHNTFLCVCLNGMTVPKRKPETNIKVLPLFFFVLSNNIQMSLVNFFVYVVFLLAWSHSLPLSLSHSFFSLNPSFHLLIFISPSPKIVHFRRKLKCFWSFRSHFT